MFEMARWIARAHETDGGTVGKYIKIQREFIKPSCDGDDVKSNPKIN